MNYCVYVCKYRYIWEVIVLIYHIMCIDFAKIELILHIYKRIVCICLTFNHIIISFL